MELVVSLVRSSREESGSYWQAPTTGKLLEQYKSDLDRSKEDISRRRAPSEEKQRDDLDRVRQALYAS